MGGGGAAGQSHKSPRRFQRQRSLPPACAPGRLQAGILELYFLWLSGALLIYFFSLCFICIFKLPAGLEAEHSPRCLGVAQTAGAGAARPGPWPQQGGVNGGSQGGMGVRPVPLEPGIWQE